MENLSLRQAKKDADTLIVNTAIDMAPIHQSVIFVGQDTELLTSY